MIIDAYHLFCVLSLKIEDMGALFACKDGFCIRVNNVRHVAVSSALSAARRNPDSVFYGIQKAIRELEQ